MSIPLAGQSYRTADSTRMIVYVRRDLLLFGALTLGLSWVPWLVLWQLRLDIGGGVGFVVFALAAASPSLAALVMRLAGRRRPRDAWTRPGLAWPVVALVTAVAPPVVTAVLTHIGELQTLPAHAAATVAGIGGPLVALAYTLISGPLAEEFGWRGFVQPRLRLRFSRLRTALILGPCWAVWHLPLFLLPGTTQHERGLVSLQGLLFFVGLIPLTYTFLYVTEHLRGGVWAGVLIHAAWNLSDALLPTSTPTGSVIMTAMFLVVASTCALAWRRTRRGTRRLPVSAGARD